MSTLWTWLREHWRPLLRVVWGDLRFLLALAGVVAVAIYMQANWQGGIAGVAGLVILRMWRTAGHRGRLFLSVRHNWASLPRERKRAVLAVRDFIAEAHVRFDAPAISDEEIEKQFKDVLKKVQDYDVKWSLDLLEVQILEHAVSEDLLRKAAAGRNGLAQPMVVENQSIPSRAFPGSS